MITLPALCRSLLVASVVLSLNCDQPAAPPRQTVAAGVLLQPVMYLQANARTLLAPTGGGVIYVAQVGGDGPQRVQRLDNAGQTRDTGLTGTRFAEALSVGGGGSGSGSRSSLGASGRAGIRAMASLGSGELVLYVGGVTRTRSLASLWVYSPATDQLRLIADDRALGSATGMGASIDVADATLVRAGRSVWLVLRHVDATRCLQLDARELAAGGEARLARPFEQLRITTTANDDDAGAAAVDATMRVLPSDEFFGREEEGRGVLWLLRRTTGETWRVNADGRLLPGDPRPTDRPPPSAPPLLLADAPNRRQLEFIPQPYQEVDPFAAPLLEQLAAKRYPFLEITGVRPALLDRDAINVRPGFPTHALRITAWCIEPASGAIFAYDEMSGELFRMQVSGV